ncbi:protein lingerer-like [Brevipalpus obovatus]|uniref:protein lingerer-like n=1 Tax=Brevipalpus obovatus TaxID=246614 RepID=UPI003D9F025D
MYGKNHPQLNKTYEKGNFQSSATPPPFNMAGAPQANILGSTYAPNPLYLQPTQPSMLHHTLQGDASQSLASGVSGQRTLSQAQKGSAANSKYYWA